MAAALLTGCGDKAVARINGEVITLSEFERQLRILKSLRPETVADEFTKRQVLEQMVKQQLLSLEAKKAGLDKDPAVVAAMQRQHSTVRDELLNSIKNAQAQLDQLDRAVEQKILIERLLDSRKSSVTVTDAEIQKVYEERQQQATQQPVPPLAQIRDQLRQQVQLEKLVETAKPYNSIELFPDVAAQGTLE